MCGWNLWRQYQPPRSAGVKHEKQVECCGAGPGHPPVVGGEGGGQGDGRLPLLQAGGGVHAARAAGAGVWGVSPGLVVLGGEERRRQHTQSVQNHCERAASQRAPHTRMFHVVLSGEALLRLASFFRPSEPLSNRDR